MNRFRFSILFLPAFLLIILCWATSLNQAHLHPPLPSPHTNPTEKGPRQTVKREEGRYPSKKSVIPPIDLDTEILLHLEEFHANVRELKKRYPNHYYTNSSTGDKKIALTFDDGPDGYTTPQIQRILDTYHIKASFFLVGQNISRYLPVVERLISKGHQIANHSWSHSRPLDINVEKLKKELAMTEKSLADLNAGQIKYFRPPYGLLNSNQMDSLVDAGYKAIGWSIDSMDWYTSNPDEIKKCVLERIHPGAIVLFHSAGGKDRRSGTIEALPDIIEELLLQGYELVTVAELLDNQ